MQFKNAGKLPESVERVDILACNHEAADTLISLHVKHAAEYGNQGINLISDDTFYGFYGVSNSDKLVRDKLIYQPHQIPLESPFVLHYQDTSCDTVSAFAGKGKLPALNILKAKGQYHIDCIQSILHNFSYLSTCFLKIQTTLDKITWGT